MSLNLDVKEVRKNLKMVDTEVSNNVKLKNQETDAIFENNKYVFNVEVNYNSYQEGIIKNSCYLANLMIRQIKSGEKYKKLKKIR